MNGKKKLVVPLVAIMMCAVALAGVVYAYSSTFNVNDNGVLSESYVLEVNDSAGTLIVEPLDIKAMDLYTETVINKSPTVDQVTVKAATISNLYKGSLLIKDSDGSDGQVSMAVTAAASPASNTINHTSVTGATGGSLTYTVTVSLYTSYTDAQTNTPYNGTVTFTSHVATLYYVIEVAVTGTGIVFSDYNNPSNAVAAVQDALEDATFALQFSATAA